MIVGNLFDLGAGTAPIHPLQPPEPAGSLLKAHSQDPTRQTGGIRYFQQSERTSTVALVTTAPDGSTTVPVIDVELPD